MGVHKKGWFNMPLKDDDFSKTNKPEEYLHIIEELQEEQDKEICKLSYDLEMEEEEEE
jgi:hypothetical protein